MEILFGNKEKQETKVQPYHEASILIRFHLSMYGAPLSCHCVINCNKYIWFNNLICNELGKG